MSSGQISFTESFTSPLLEPNSDANVVNDLEIENSENEEENSLSGEDDNLETPNENPNGRNVNENPIFEENANAEGNANMEGNANEEDTNANAFKKKPRKKKHQKFGRI